VDAIEEWTGVQTNGRFALVSLEMHFELHHVAPHDLGIESELSSLRENYVLAKITSGRVQQLIECMVSALFSALGPEHGKKPITAGSAIART
jgi:hypothetical protein